MIQLETRFSGASATISRKPSYASPRGRLPSISLPAGQQQSIEFPRFRIQEKKCEPTHFHWATSAKQRAAQQNRLGAGGGEGGYDISRIKIDVNLILYFQDIFFYQNGTN